MYVTSQKLWVNYKNNVVASFSLRLHYCLHIWFNTYFSAG